MRPFSKMAGVQRFEDLLAWQRGNELHIEVWKATGQAPASRDFRFKDQIRDASESIERNGAEGFGRFNPGQFAHFLDIARSSALETKTLLRKGFDVGWPPRSSRAARGRPTLQAARCSQATHTTGTRK